MSRIIQLSDLNVSGGEALYPVTIGSAVTVIRDGNSVSLQSVVDEIPSASGGGGGGSTQNIVAINATLPADGTGASYISTDGGNNYYTISLPSVFPTGWVIGNINSSGQISGSGSTVASGDKLLIAKSSDGEINKSVAFGSSTTTFLRNDGQWAAPPSGGGGSTTLGGLTDVTISGASNGQVLTYSSGAWVNSAVPTELPSLTGNGGKVLAVNSGATGVEWITNSGGGGGSTVTIPALDITLSGSNQLYITVNGTSRYIKLPSLGTINYPSSNIPGGSITGSSTQGGTGEPSNTNQVDIASGDRLVIGDWSARGTTQSSSHYPLKLSSISFGSSTTTYLRNDGTWATPSGGGGGGGSTVTLPSGYNASTGITLSSSALTTVATVDGVNLNLRAPAASFSDGIGISITGTDTINAVAAECETIGKALVPKEHEYILPVLSPGQSPAVHTVLVSQYNDGNQHTGGDITGMWPTGERLDDKETTPPNYLHVSLPTALSVLLSKLWDASEESSLSIVDIIDRMLAMALE